MLRLKKRTASYLVFGAIALFTPQAAFATCLQASRGGWTGWVNNCNYPIWVNWNDNNNCGNWSCSDRVGGNSRSSATIGNNVQWCEWRYPASGRGPC
jgi:hypothetical protein